MSPGRTIETWRWRQAFANPSPRREFSRYSEYLTGSFRSQPSSTGGSLENSRVGNREFENGLQGSHAALSGFFTTLSSLMGYEGAAGTDGPQEGSIADDGTDDVPPITNAELVQLRVRVITLENLVITLLVRASNRQLILAA